MIFKFSEEHIILKTFEKNAPCSTYFQLKKLVRKHVTKNRVDENDRDSQCCRSLNEIIPKRDRVLEWHRFVT